MPRALRTALPAVLLGLAILCAAGPWASSSRTGAWAGSFLEVFGVPADVAVLVHVVLRKAGHVLAYALFGVLALRAAGGDAPATTAGHARGAALASLLLAAADEGLQGLSPERGGSALDVLLDAAGAVAGNVLARLREARAAAAPR